MIPIILVNRSIRWLTQWLHRYVTGVVHPVWLLLAVPVAGLVYAFGWLFAYVFPAVFLTAAIAVLILTWLNRNDPETPMVKAIAACLMMIAVMSLVGMGFIHAIASVIG